MESKFNFAVLDGWINLEDFESDIDYQSSYLDKIELTQDQEFAFKDSFYLDKLFNKKVRHRRAWDLQEEQQLLGWYQKFKGTPSRQAWEEQSIKMQRSICSIYTKVCEMKKQTKKRKRKESVENKQLSCTVNQAVHQALKTIGFPASKKEIIKQISDCYEMPERGSWINSVKQFISSSKNLVKHPGIYKIKTMQIIQKNDCSSMEKMILFALQFLGGQAEIKQIKEVIESEFDQILNDKVNPDSQLKVWEKTFLKKLKQSTQIDKSNSEEKYELLQVTQINTQKPFLLIFYILKLRTSCLIEINSFQYKKKQASKNILEIIRNYYIGLYKQSLLSQ